MFRGLKRLRWLPEIFSANKVIIIVTTKMIVIKIIIAEKLKGPPLTYRVENTYFMCDSVYVLRGIARRRSSFFSSFCSRPFSKLISSPPSITPPSSPQRIPPEKKIHISIMASFQIQRNQYLLTFSFMSFVVWTSGWECGAGSEPITTQSKGNHWNPGLPSTFRQMALVSGVTSNSSLPFYRASGSLNFFFYFKVSLAIFSINLCSPLVFIRV